MTIGKQDVLDTLNQPAVKRFKFTVGSLTVSPQGYADVCKAVSDGDIDVKPGSSSDAVYDRGLNTIFTQNGNPPLNVADRAQLLHECTHAIFDAYGWVTNLREDEVAAYLAQLTFMFIVNPVPFPHHLGRTGRPFADLIFGFAAVIEKYRLHELAGFGALIDPMDTAALKLLVVQMPKYAALGPAGRLKQRRRARNAQPDRGAAPRASGSAPPKRALQQRRRSPAVAQIGRFLIASGGSLLTRKRRRPTPRA